METDPLVKTKKIIERTAARAIIFKDGDILMVSNNKGDVKFPGGGLEMNETHGEAICREVKEETGYLVSDIMSKVGLVTERRIDIFEHDCLFEMNSHYYLCKIHGAPEAQSLSDYEIEQEFVPIWINIIEAIGINEKAIQRETRNPWVARELYVLKQLKECF
jgi:8-oxo-dGTP pyrophosphatase MutT (NUDIX family)